MSTDARALWLQSAFTLCPKKIGEEWPESSSRPRINAPPLLAHIVFVRSSRVFLSSIVTIWSADKLLLPTAIMRESQPSVYFIRRYESKKDYNEEDEELVYWYQEN
uniref:Uncharacterized protein n=1 Tax=Caenorhabditis tropicalis TaxID=1561998 RepID=A0A1I7TZW5_9PELO